jgi:hypothetical protein
VLDFLQRRVESTGDLGVWGPHSRTLVVWVSYVYTNEGQGAVLRVPGCSPRPENSGGTNDQAQPLALVTLSVATPGGNSRVVGEGLSLQGRSKRGSGVQGACIALV